MRLKIDKPYSNISQYSITDNARIIQDGYLDEANAIAKRPGLSVFLDLSTVDTKYASKPIDGMYWFDEVQQLLVVCDGDLLSINDKFGTSITTLATAVFSETGNQVTFAKVADSADSNTPTVFMANGGAIVYTTGTSGTVLSGANIPTRVTHVAGLDGYLICNDLDQPNRWLTSDATTPKVFSSAFTYSAQAATDNIRGLYVSKSIVWVYGRDSMEAFYDSGFATPFQRITGSLVETGCVNPYALARIGSDVYFLNSERDIVYLKAGSYSPVIVSSAYSKRLRSFNSVQDVRACALTTTEGRKFVLFNLNDAGLSIVYDPMMDAIYEWGTWLPESNVYDQFPSQTFEYVSDWNKSLMGSSTAGIIYELSEDNVSDDSTPIRFMVETGTYDLGDPVASKAIQKLFLHTSRGSGLESDPDNYSAKAFLEYRKNYTQAWTNPAIEVDLGRKGETQLIDCRGIGGVFRTIQFRITQQDNTRFALCGIYLDYGGG